MTKSRIKVEGRAIAARPLVFFGTVVLAMLFFPALAAALPAPTLTATNPLSPGASSTPRIKGNVEEGETKVITFGSLRPIAQDVEPNDAVRIYTTSDCTGPTVGEGTVSGLKGEGILVAAVLPDSVTVYYANVSNGLETSGCSNGLTYRQVTTPPATPALTAVSPASPANNNFPRLLGNADADATVSIYADGTCSGAVVATGTGAELGAEGIQATVADNTDTTFSAILTIAGFVSGCSNPISYQEVTPPDPGPGPGPDPGPGGGTPSNPPAAPRLRTLPAGAANNNTPLIAGTAPGANVVRIYADPNCQGAIVAKGSPADLAAGIPVRVMDNAVVVFSAVSVAGEKSSKCSDPIPYVEDSLTPRTRITMAPGAKTAKRKATIRFTDSTGAALPGTTFLCKIDKAKWKKCASPLRLKKLKLKRYTIKVKARDAAGNAETKGAKRSFKVIARP